MATKRLSGWMKVWGGLKPFPNFCAGDCDKDQDTSVIDHYINEMKDVDLRVQQFQSTWQEIDINNWILPRVIHTLLKNLKQKTWRLLWTKEVHGVVGRIFFKTVKVQMIQENIRVIRSGTKFPISDSQWWSKNTNIKHHSYPSKQMLQRASGKT